MSIPLPLEAEAFSFLEEQKQWSSVEHLKATRHYIVCLRFEMGRDCLLARK